MKKYKMKYVGLNLFLVIPTIITLYILLSVWLNIPTGLSIAVSLIIGFKEAFLESKLSFLQDEINKINNQTK